MDDQRVELFPIACARDLGEAIRIQMLLDRARLPYTMKGDNLFGIYGNAALSIAGPMEFLIPAELRQQAEESLMEIFDVHTTNLPSNCPACEARLTAGEIDCPNCGLFLG